MPGLHEKLKQKFQDAVIEIHAQHGDETAVVTREVLWDVLQFLKSDPEAAMDVLMDLTAVDGLKMQWEPRFEVVYHLYSMT